MERSGLGSKRIDMFPSGLRVLVVDDDPTWLKILEKMLKKCSYEVTKCSLATEALDILRKRKDGFDIVISDVNMPDMDGFKLLEHVGLEMNLPVIMMSVDGEITRVMKGVLHGACDYLLKPIRMKELQNIWQHVLRKKIHKVKDIENHEGSEAQMIRSDVGAFDDSHLLVGGDFASARKRKDSEHLELYDHDFSDPSAAKKARVVWSVDLHQKFVNAVNQVGLDKVGPKKILDLMNVQWLTRENVASHLQKYRLYLSRLQKQSSPSHDATKPDFSSVDLSSSFNLQSSTAVHQNTATSCSFGYSGNKMHVQDANPELQEVTSKARLPFLSITNPQTDLIANVPRFQKLDNALRTGHTNSTLRTGHTNSFGLGPNVNYALFEPTENSPTIQFTPSPTEEHKLTGYMHRPKHHIQADLMQTAPSVNIGNSIAGRVKVDPVNMKPLCTMYGNNHISTVSRTPHRVGSLSVKPQINAANTEVSDNVPSNIISASTKKQTFDQWCTSIWGTQPKNSIMGSLPSLPSPQRNANLLPLQDGCVENVGFGNLDFSDYLAPELITEVPSHLHDGTRFNSDFLFDSIEYPTISEGLFIT